MNPQKCVFKKCNFKYLITGKLRLTTTFRSCGCIFLAHPPPMFVIILFPLSVYQHIADQWSWRGGRGGWGGGLRTDSERRWQGREGIKNSICL